MAVISMKQLLTENHEKEFEGKYFKLYHIFLI